MPAWSMDDWQYLERQVVADPKGRLWSVALMDVLGQAGDPEIPNKLLEFQRKGGDLENRFLDQLLTMALIEARSCERFKRLSEGLDDEYLRNIYRRFMESEAGHYHLFINLCETYIDKAAVRGRWQE